MEHVFYCDGNQKKISWVIETGKKSIEQYREHHEIYYDKVTSVQSKYVALHVGIFWGVGNFIIKNNDTVKVMLDSNTMYAQLSKNVESDDGFVKNRMMFVNQLISQRKLNLHYQLIDIKNNLASKLIAD